ncbi:beta subunit of N-acylethanolamine-hydrolyzing acid amidase-domain-containing protein [Colletotrichum cereale]|nr:beta subunit of N-acylethanolamine-hydrolyzing acid amidase-domain-containing protein [Colletotrichum cereale]
MPSVSPRQAQQEEKQTSAFPTMFTPALGNIPIYRIDMGKPPEERYIELAKEFAPQIRNVSPIFDEVIESLFGRKLAGVVKFASRYALRRVFDEEQTKEIRSIAAIAKIGTHLLMSLNLFLDLMLGCTSGAALVRPVGEDTKDRLMHFRTLEWGMDALRELLVIVEFVDSSKGGPDEVVARSVSYAGFVGCLTGVRKDLSVSLNFRPTHDCPSHSLRKHQLLVLLGRREAVPSILRRMLLNENIPSNSLDVSFDKNPPAAKKPKQITPSVTAAVKKFISMPTSPCYITLCDGFKVVGVLKDLCTGRAKKSSLFQVQCNHDLDHETCCGHKANNSPSKVTQAIILSNEDWLDESEERQQALEEKWLQHMAAVAKKTGPELQGQRNSICLDADIPAEFDRDIEVPGVSEPILQQWVKTYPTTNEYTHFACIMDPASGNIRWIARGPEASDPSGSDN